jgi:putative peptidoglycan lipid II flippase
MTVFFAINKIAALARQYVVTKQFGLSAEIDAFNVSNNLPDLLFSLIAGSALAFAIIPVLTEYFDKEGKEKAWKLFSQVTNIVFLLTLVLAVLVGIFAEPLISSPIGIAPGFTPDQQKLAADLMRINLFATMIFSISGLAMSGLQANKHFLLPAVAPILYNIGQIIGATVIAPFFGIGAYGLAYGVVIGAVLHLAIQIPGLLKYGFKWNKSLGLKDEGVQKVIRLMGPRILTVLFIQIMFLTRDNLASSLQEGTVSALTYGYYIMQVPETLIGTAIGTALLPTLAQFAEQKKQKEFGVVLNKTIRVMFALTIIITVISFLSLPAFIAALFNFSTKNNQLLVWITNAYMIGLFAQCLLEVTTRAFYANQDAKTPFYFTFARMIGFIMFAIILMRFFGPIGLALADTLAVSLVVFYSLYLLKKQIPQMLSMNGTLIRTLAAAVITAFIIYILIYILPFPILFSTIIAVGTGGVAALFIIRRELLLLLNL